MQPPTSCLTLFAPPAPAPRPAQVFGKTLVCRSLDIAARVSKDTDLNCVTMEGDQVERRGTFRGGFYDASRSKIQAMKEIKVGGGAIACV